MKGILFNHLEKLTDSALEPGAWNRLCEELPIETKERFIANRTYPDSDLKILLEGFASEAKKDINDAWKEFGKVSILSFMEKYSGFIDQYTSPRGLLEDINTLHFTKVRDKFSETELPFFIISNIRKDSLHLCYVSKRKMCFYLQGALNGVGEHFKMPLSFAQTRCVHEGSELCEFEIRFE